MENTINTKAIVKALTSDTVLIRVRAKKWAGGKVDKSSASIVAEKYGGDEMGWNNASMRLLPPDYRKRLSKISGAVGTALAATGIPYDGGWLVRTTDYAKVRAETDLELAALAAFVDELILDRQIIENWIRTKLQDAYHDRLLPSNDELRGKFAQTITVTPIGEPPESLGAAGDGVREGLAQQYNEAMADQVNALREMVTSLKDIVTEVVAGDKAKFKGDNRWAAFSAQLDKVEKMKVTADGFTEVASTIRLLVAAIKGITSKEVKENPLHADALKKGCDGIQSLLDDF